LEHGTPALILLDIAMPDIDGFDLLHQIRRKHGADILPILLLTASSDGKDIVRGLTTGANDFLTKPIDRTAFLARVYNQINLAQLRRLSDEKRLKVASMVGIQQAIEELNNEAVLVHRLDGGVVYGNTLLTALVADADASQAHLLLSRLIGEDALREIQAFIGGRPEHVWEGTVSLSPSVCDHGFGRSSRVRTTLHGDVRIWVFNLESSTSNVHNLTPMHPS
jgi:CheY-like chemotaxis protein